MPTPDPRRPADDSFQKMYTCYYSRYFTAAGILNNRFINRTLTIQYRNKPCTVLISTRYNCLRAIRYIIHETSMISNSFFFFFLNNYRARYARSVFGLYSNRRRVQTMPRGLMFLPRDAEISSLIIIKIIPAHCTKRPYNVSCLAQ